MRGGTRILWVVVVACHARGGDVTIQLCTCTPPSSADDYCIILYVMGGTRLALGSCECVGSCAMRRHEPGGERDGGRRKEGGVGWGGEEEH